MIYSIKNLCLMLRLRGSSKYSKSPDSGIGLIFSIRTQAIIEGTHPTSQRKSGGQQHEHQQAKRKRASEGEAEDSERSQSRLK